MSVSNYDVAIIDYGMGNIFSVKQACEQVGLDAVITCNKDEILNASGAILPGVGAFGDAMENLRKNGLIPVITDFIARGKPFMGICLGMQLLLSESDEFGLHKGLGIIAGRVTRFKNLGWNRMSVKIPQVGWNRIFPLSTKWADSLLSGISEGEYMYFNHSFYCMPENVQFSLAVTDYEGTEYCSSLEKDNVFATQFHPEKSAEYGIKIYENWSKKVLRQKNN